MGSPSIPLRLLSLLVVLVLSLVPVETFVCSFPGAPSAGRPPARIQALWRSPWTASFCSAISSGSGDGLERVEKLSRFVFPPAEIDISKLSKEEIVTLARLFMDMQEARAEAEKEKERRRLVEYLLVTERTNGLQKVGALHARGLLEVAEKDVKKWVKTKTGKVGRGRRDWWMTFVSETEEGQFFVDCLRRKELLDDVEDTKVASVVADTMVGIYKRINSLMHPPVRNLGAVSIIEGPLTAQECLYVECIADELEGVHYETIWREKQTKHQEKMSE